MSPQRAQFLADVIIGAVEGGTGYWAQVSAYRHECDPADTTATLHDMEEDRGALILTTGNVAKAITTIVNNKDISLSDTIRHNIAGAYGCLDAGYLDADECDVIAQVALLGDVIYG